MPPSIPAAKVLVTTLSLLIVSQLLPGMVTLSSICEEVDIRSVARRKNPRVTAFKAKLQVYPPQDSIRYFNSLHYRVAL